MRCETKEHESKLRLKDENTWNGKLGETKKKTGKEDIGDSRGIVFLATIELVLKRSDYFRL